MKFCKVCGSYLKETHEGLWCPRCKRLTPSKSKTKVGAYRKKEACGVCLVDEHEKAASITSEKCPECGNDEAFHWVSVISGEHAGVRGERTVEHFRCTKCSHTWTRST